MTEFDPSVLPPRPDIIPPELRQFSVDNTEWNHRVPPQALGMFIAAVVQWLSNPRFAAKVISTTRDDGWTIDITLTPPEIRDDIELP